MKWKCTLGDHCLSPVNFFFFYKYIFTFFFSLLFFSCSVFPVLPGGNWPPSDSKDTFQKKWHVKWLTLEIIDS